MFLWQDILASLSPLLNQVLDLPSEERAGWLAELRTHQPELAVELQALLEDEARLDARGFSRVPPELSWPGCLVLQQ